MEKFQRTKRYVKRDTENGPLLQSDSEDGPWEPCEEMFSPNYYNRQTMKVAEVPVHPESSEGIGELIERLCIANLKLWAVCDKKANAANMTQEDLRVLVADDLNLCKSRAAIRAEINKRLGSASGETVKHYAEAEES